MTRIRPAGPLILSLILAALAPPRSGVAVNVRIDYSQDGSGFFSSATTEGRRARASVEAAANVYSGLLEDSLAPVTVPSRYFGVGGGTANFYLRFADPNAPLDQDRYVNLAQYSIAQDEYVVFVGGAALSGTSGKQIASAGLGGAGYDYSLVESDVPIVEQIFADFADSYESRGQASGFAHWGGTISFDHDGSTSWNVNIGALPSAGQSDLYSVALHELGHVLGFGHSALQEEGLVNGSNRFVGANAVEAFGGPVPLHSDRGHWAEGTRSAVLATGASQETLYDPTFNGSARKELTLLDAAGLVDLGWEMTLPDMLPGDFNSNSRVDAADYTVWRDGLGGSYHASDYQMWSENYGSQLGGAAPDLLAAPAPSSLALLCVTLVFPCRRRAECRR